VNFTIFFKKFIEDEGYTLCQVFNTNGTSIWWKLHALKLFVHHGETHAKKNSNNLKIVILMACANGSKTCKLSLVFIHKSARPRCFKDVIMDALPVKYFAQ